MPGGDRWMLCLQTCRNKTQGKLGDGLRDTNGMALLHAFRAMQFDLDLIRHVPIQDNPVISEDQWQLLSDSWRAAMARDDNDALGSILRNSLRLRFGVVCVSIPL